MTPSFVKFPFELISHSLVNLGKYLPKIASASEKIVLLKISMLFAFGIASAGLRGTQNAGKGMFDCLVE